MKHFSWSIFLFSRKFWTVNLNDREKGPFWKGFFEIVKILEHPFFSEYFQKTSVEELLIR